MAVVPFGARGPDAAVGVVARQLARRVVERLERETAVELRPVFLVSVPEDATEAGYVVLGSTPDADLAAGYGSSLGCTHALVGTLREEGGRTLELSLIDVATKRPLREGSLPAPAGALQRIEGQVAAWVAHALGVELADRGDAPAASEDAYKALLEGMDAELSATLLASGSPAAARASRVAALERYAAAISADPGCVAAEERVLVMAAESLGTDAQAEHVTALEAVSEARPGSWKAHYLLGELRQAEGDLSGAVVALEHADALEPLRPADSIRLAELYVEAGARSSAAARLRRVRRGLAADAAPETRLLLAHALIRIGDAEGALGELERILHAEPSGPVAARARRLGLGARHPDLELELERAGALALGGSDGEIGDAAAAFERVLAAEPDLWEAQLGLGLVARRQGDGLRAERAFRRALELLPGQPDATHELGVAELMRGAADEAAVTLDRAAALRPDDAGYLADAGLAQLRAGRLVQARERLERAAALDAADPLIRAYRAELERVEAQIGTTGRPEG